MWVFILLVSAGVLFLFWRKEIPDEINGVNEVDDQVGENEDVSESGDTTENVDKTQGADGEEIAFTEYCYEEEICFMYPRDWEMLDITTKTFDIVNESSHSVQSLYARVSSAKDGAYISLQKVQVLSGTTLEDVVDDVLANETIEEVEYRENGQNTVGYAYTTSEGYFVKDKIIQSEQNEGGSIVLYICSFQVVAEEKEFYLATATNVTNSFAIYGIPYENTENPQNIPIITDES